jgi:photosystem II stability/assembly factor-like uncharacterized protein
MDRLRRDLRDMFDRRQEGLGDVAGARRRVMQAALARRDEPMGRRTQLIAGLATAVLAALVVVTFAYIRLGGGHQVTPPAAKPSPSPSAPVQTTPVPPTGFVVLDADLVDASNGSVLFTNCIQPMTGQCKYFVATTADGGQTWSKPVQVGPGFDPTNGDAPRHVHFINLRDGIVFGGTETYLTHDGGRTWTGLGLQQTFFSYVGGSSQRLWTVTWPCAKAAPCQFQVRSSVDAGRKWSAPDALPSGFTPYDVVSFGNQGLLISSEPIGDMELTTDGGATWKLIPSRCTGNLLQSVVATSDGRELWELCLRYPDLNTSQSTKTLFMSEDGGTSWSKHALAPVSADQAASGYQMILLNQGPGSAVMATNMSTVSVTHDSGKTWANAGGLDGSGFQAVKFADASNGWAIDNNKNIWITRDGGDSWQQMAPYQPPQGTA